MTGLALLLGGAFAAGWVSANLPIATSVNAGLVEALNSVGQNLFGSAVFAARLYPVDPFGPDLLQIDLATDVGFPTARSLFLPPSPITPTAPCRVVAPLRAGGEDGLVLLVDSAVAGAPLVDADLSDIRPNDARCPSIGMGDGCAGPGHDQGPATAGDQPPGSPAAGRGDGDPESKGDAYAPRGSGRLRSWCQLPAGRVSPMSVGAGQAT